MGDSRVGRTSLGWTIRHGLCCGLGGLGRGWLVGGIGTGWELLGVGGGLGPIRMMRILGCVGVLMLGGRGW